VIATCRRQRSFADGFIFDEVKDLWEPWMRHADKALEDEALLLLIQQELMKRCKKSVSFRQGCVRPLESGFLFG